MATPWQRYQYKDPTAVDVSTFGKVQTLKQEKYDANTAQIQELITKYTNMQLLRPQDSEYLGNRINKLVSYVEQAGPTDYSNQNIVRNVTGYISSALDDNVMAAISSTQTYQRQQAEFAEMKKANNGMYNVKNEWMATRNLKAYMEGELGDVYQAQAYIPYVDVDARVMKNAGLLEQFAKDVQVSYSDTGSPYLKYKSTNETLTAEKARPLIAMMIGEDGMQQLNINAQYNARDMKPDQIQSTFTGYIDEKIQNVDRDISYVSERMKMYGPEQKKRAAQNIQDLQESKKRLQETKTTTLNPEQMLFAMERDRVLTGYSNAFTFDRVTDLSIDTSELDVAKHHHNVTMDGLNYNLKVNNANLESRKFEVEVMSKVSKGEILVGPDGQIMPNPNYVATTSSSSSSGGIGGDGSGIVQTPAEEIPGEENRKYDPVSVVNSYNVERRALVDKLVAEGNVNRAAAKALVTKMTNEMLDGDRSVYENYKSTLSPESAKILDRIAAMQPQFKVVNTHMKEATRDFDKLTEGILSSPTATNAVYTESEVVRNGIKQLQSGKKLEDLDTETKNYLRMAAYLNMREDPSVSDEHKVELELYSAMAMSGLGGKNLETIREELGDKGGNAALEWFKGQFADIQSVWYSLAGDEDSAREYDKKYREHDARAGEMLSDNHNKNNRSLFGKNARFTEFDSGETNLVDAEGNTKVDAMRYLRQMPSKLRMQKNEEMLNTQSLQMVDTHFDLESADGKAILPNLKALVSGVGTIDVKQSAIFRVDPEGGLKAFVPIKGAKSSDPTVMHEVDVPPMAVPQVLLEKMDFKIGSEVYDITNPYAQEIKYSDVGLFENSAERTTAYNQMNPQYANSTYGDAKKLGKTVDEAYVEIKNAMPHNKDLIEQHESTVRSILRANLTISTYPNLLESQWGLKYESSDGRINNTRNTGLTNMQPLINGEIKIRDVASELIKEEAAQYIKSLE